MGDQNYLQTDSAKGIKTHFDGNMSTGVILCDSLKLHYKGNRFNKICQLSAATPRLTEDLF